jgi:hypothetical protein
VPPAARRELRFESLADAVRDAERLLAAGYVRVGNWSVGQCCGHLANWLRYPIDGFPRMPLALRPVAWLVRTTVGPRIGRRMLATRRMGDGWQTIPVSVPGAGTDDAAAVAEYRRAVERWEGHAGPLHPSPLFGAMPKDDWRVGHCVHAAHHLSFLVPKGG